MQFVAEFGGQDEENIRKYHQLSRARCDRTDATYPISLAKSLHNEGHTIAWREAGMINLLKQMNWLISW